MGFFFLLLILLLLLFFLLLLLLYTATEECTQIYQFRQPTDFFFLCFFLFLKHENFPSIKRPNKLTTAASAHQSPPTELQSSHHDCFTFSFKKKKKKSTPVDRLSGPQLLPAVASRAHPPRLPDDINTRSRSEKSLQAETLHRPNALSVAAPAASP